MEPSKVIQMNAKNPIPVFGIESNQASNIKEVQNEYQ